VTRVHLLAALAAMVGVLFACANADHNAEPPMPAEREAALWPFSAASPWNTPIGSGAQLSAPDDPRTQALVNGQVPAWVNAGRYSHPIYVAQDTDPVRTVRDDGRGGQTVELHIPAAAEPAAGDDSHLNIVDPTGRFVDELWRVRDQDGVLVAGYHARVDLMGDGLSDGARAYGGSAIAGLIRSWELDDGVIRHALAIALRADQLRTGPVWPATRQDSDAAASYRGPLPMGSLIAIPRDVNLGKLHLSSAGMAVARALQRYGGYVVDRSNGLTLYAEPALEGSPRLDALRHDINRLRSELRVVVNNGPSAIGGGGQPTIAPAPVLVP